VPTTRVSEVNFLSEDLFELVLERDGMMFEPGNCFAISHPSGASRPYSASSGVEDSQLRFLIRRMHGGRVSPWLADRTAGDPVYLSDPFGWFRPGQSGEPSDRSVFIATGTGIAPFVSALRSLPDLQPIVCLYGVRHLADAAALDYLHGRCVLKPCISRESAPPYHHGRVTDLLDEVPIGGDINYYLCGLDAMIEEAGQRLQKHGVHYAQIHREVFFHA